MLFLRLLIPQILILLLTIGVIYGFVRNIIRLCRGRMKVHHTIILAICTLVISIIVWGFTIGFSTLHIERVEYASDKLPKAFNGYRIVMFSDAHVGNFNGWRAKILRNAIKEINNQDADIICFCGDIENKSPDELQPFIQDFKSLKAKDGVFAVLGNHDYSLYLHDATKEEQQNELQRTIATEESFGWRLLRNENTAIHRSNDSIFIIGEENQGSGPFPKMANVEKATQDIPLSAFSIMLQHDPTAWKEHILEKTNAHLTLSGHTHAGQFSLLGWSPVTYFYDTVRGIEMTNDNRMLFVSSGLGGVVPFRFGVPGEIVVITLKTKAFYN